MLSLFHIAVIFSFHRPTFAGPILSLLTDIAVVNNTAIIFVPACLPSPPPQKKNVSEGRKSFSSSRSSSSIFSLKQ